MTQLPLPDLAQDLAADAALARLAVGHQALIGGQDRDSHAAENPRDAFGLRVDAQAGTRDALQSGDRAAAVAGVLHLDRQALPRTARVGHDFEARDVAL